MLHQDDKYFNVIFTVINFIIFRVKSEEESYIILINVCHLLRILRFIVLIMSCNVTSKQAVTLRSPVFFLVICIL